jgi:hypothetical protein
MSVVDSLSTIVGTANTGLQDAIEFVKHMAPQLWAIALRQAYVSMWMAFGWAGLSLIGLISLIVVWIRTCRPLYAANDGEMWPNGDVAKAAFTIAGLITFVILLISNLHVGIQIALNPNWAALDILRHMR